METDKLIQALATDAAPVARLRPAWQRALVWLVACIPVVAVAVWLHGTPTGPADILADPRMTIEMLAIIGTAGTAAWAAFMSATPGADRRVLWLPLVPLAVWLATLGQGCASDFGRMGWEAFALRPDGDCVPPAIMASIVPLILIGVMIRRGAPVMPAVTLFYAALAVAAVVNVGMLLFHVGDISFQILVWHAGTALVIAAIFAFAAPWLFTWRRPSSITAR